MKPIGDVTDPQGLAARATAYVEHLRARNFSDVTITNRASHLRIFVAWCARNGVEKPTDVTRGVAEAYQEHLAHFRTDDGKPLNSRTINGRLFTVKQVFRWLAKRNEILFNPAADLELPKQERRLPRCVMTASEVERVMMQAVSETPTGLRDRAIMETLYSTGMRRKEVARLKVGDIDVERGTVFVRLGKGRKDRVVPIGERAMAWIRKYLSDVRPQWVDPSSDDDTLFLNWHGKPMHPDSMSRTISEYIVKAELGKMGSCHAFRHSAATVMLEGGADIRFIQQLLGHEQLSTTEIYTRVSIKKLKEVHAKTHPSAQLKRNTPSDDEEMDG